MRLNISYATWIGQTQRRGKPRSRALEKIDKALRLYEHGQNRANLKLLQGAINHWVNKKGPGWKASIRNQQQTVENLKTEVDQLMQRMPSLCGPARPDLYINEFYTLNKAEVFKDIPDEEFNCFTYIIGGSLWEVETSNPKNLHDCDEAYARFGYTRIYPDPDESASRPPALRDEDPIVAHEPGFTKVVVFGGEWRNGNFEVLHHALRVPDGWHSKLGYLPLVFHKTLRQLEGVENGRPRLLYKKAGSEMRRSEGIRIGIETS